MVTKIGFIGAGSDRGHMQNFKALIPEGVLVEFAGSINIVQDSLQDYRGTLDRMVKQVEETVSLHQWEAVALPGAPKEVFNPGLFQRLKETVNIPAVTAMAATSAALQACSAKRILLMTPFDETVNKGIRDYMAAAGIEATSAPQTVPVYTDALGLTSDRVLDLTRNAMQGVGSVDAIYFQGAILDPLDIIEQLEEEFQTTVVASNPAMLWYMLSALGLTYHIHSKGKLLEQWPSRAS
jgi:maleate cis-trans isomerase